MKQFLWLILFCPLFSISQIDCNNVQILQQNNSICSGDSLTLSVTNIANCLVAYYPFNGNANDESGNGNDGTVFGATLTNDRFGNPNGAYNFNGTDNYINIGSDPILNRSNTDFSINVWINTHTPTGPPFQTIITNRNPNYQGSLFGLRWETGDNYQKLGLTSGDPNNAYTNVTNISTYTWYNLCVTHKASTDETKFYIDGVEIYTTTSFGDFNAPSSPNTTFHSIGLETQGHPQGFISYPFDGEIDDLRLYNCCLTPLQIQELYNNQSLSYSWSTNETTPSITVSPNQNTTYYVTVSDGVTTCQDSITIQVSQDTSYTNVSLCDSSSYTWNDSTYTQSGTYYHFENNNTNTSSLKINDTTTTQNYINFGNAPELNPDNSNGYTISWQYHPSLTWNDWSTWVYDQMFDGGGFYCYLSATHFKLVSANYSSIDEIQIDLYSNPKWTNFTIVFEQNMPTKLYIDGIFNTTLNILSQQIDPNSHMIYGLDPQNVSQNKSHIDNLYIFDTALPEVEIYNYVSCPPNINHPNLIRYYNFDSGSGNIIYDQLPNSTNHASIESVNNNLISYWDTNLIPSSTCTLTNSNGCVSVAVLNLTLNNSTSNTDVITACDSYTWIDGNTYTASTNDPYVPTLHTINAGNFYYYPNSLTINAGDTVKWINDGGYHNVNFINSTITGNSFNNPVSFVTPPTTLTDLAMNIFDVPGTYNYDCSVGSHAVNGMTGTLIVLPPPPTYTIPNAVGCDSVITLDLTINSSSASTDPHTACQAFTWIDGNTYTASNNTATYT